MHKVIIADNSMDFGILLSGALRSRYLVEVCDNGNAALELLRSSHADVLVLDLMIPGLDALELLGRVRSEGLASAIIVISRFFSDYTADALMQHHVDYAAVKPCHIPSLCERVDDLCAGLSTQEDRETAPYCAISSILLSLGFQTHRVGFQYCRDSILIMARKPGLQVTKNVYPDVGKPYGANGTAVEKAIRIVITDAWERRNDGIWRMYFPAAPNGQIPKPTNTQFLTRIADAVSMSRRAVGDR